MRVSNSLRKCILVLTEDVGRIRVRCRLTVTVQMMEEKISKTSYGSGS